MRLSRRHAITALGPGAAAVALSSALAVGPTASASAAEQDFSIVVPAGQACAGFDLGIHAVGSKRIMREFTDANGQVVRTLAAGKGYTLTFTNMRTGARVTLPSNGSVSRTTVNSDGSLTVESTGHNVIVFFPTDIPAGPLTTLYVGRIVYTVDAAGVFTLRSVSGKTTDLCALLR